MQIFFVLLLNLFQFHSLAHANTPFEVAENLPADTEVSKVTSEEVDGSDLASTLNLGTDSIRVLGRGIQNKETQTVLQVVCVGQPAEGTLEPSCKKISFYEWSPSNPGILSKATPFAIELKDEKSDLNTLKNYLKHQSKKIDRRIREERRDKRRNSQNGFVGFYAVGGATFGGAIWFAAVNITALGASALLCPIGVFVGMIVLGKYIDRAFEALDFTALFRVPPKLSLNGISLNVSTVSLDDRGGWNWSTKPIQVKAKSYDRLLGVIRDMAFKPLPEEIKSVPFH